jgi:hypothetical protein
MVLFGEGVAESFGEPGLFVQLETMNSGGDHFRHGFTPDEHSGRKADLRPAFPSGKRIGSGRASVSLEEPDHRESGP